MKITKKIALVFVFLGSFYSFAQNESFPRYISGKTYFMSSIYHLGGYAKERPIFYLEQNFTYRFHSKFSVGTGLGINLYPSLLGFPVYLNGKYHFKISSFEMYVFQSYGLNVKIGDVFFQSNRYIGSIGGNIKLGEKMQIAPEIGYSLIWDKYGGGALSFFIGIGIEYQIKKLKSKEAKLH